MHAVDARVVGATRIAPRRRGSRRRPVPPSGSRVGALAVLDSRLLLVALATPRRAGGGSEAVEELERMG